MLSKRKSGTQAKLLQNYALFQRKKETPEFEKEQSSFSCQNFIQKML